MNANAKIMDKTIDLDAFAPPASSGSLPTVRPMAGAPERVFGAQAVAVYRDEKKVLQKLATLAAAAGTDWFYRFPVKKKGGGTDYIEGASIKLANDVARVYGNCDVDTRVYDLGDSWLFYARFTDFETGYALTRPFQQRKNQSSMKTDSDRALDIAFQIGASKAIRNVICNALQTYADYAFEEARSSIVDKVGKRLDEYRNRVLQGLENSKVDKVRVERVMGRAAADWTAPDVAKVIAMMQAIADNMATWEDTFPSKDQPAGEAQQSGSDELDDFGEAGAQAGNGAAAGQQQQPATAQQQPAQQTEQQAAKPGKAAQKAAADKTPEAKKDEAKKDEPKPEPQAAQTAGESDELDEMDNEAAEAAQSKVSEKPKVPTNEVEYQEFALAHIAALKSSSDVKTWFTSAEQKKLRGDCKVGEAVLNTVRDAAKKRMSDLAQKKA